MHFATQNVSGHRTTKLALVVVFHIVLGVCLVQSMGVKLRARPVEATPFTLVPDVVIPVPPQLTDALPPPMLSAPPVFVPQVEVPLPTPALRNTITTTTTASADPVPSARTIDATTTPPETFGTGVAKVRSAAMVDGCAKPDYPKQAARNGDAGIVTLALLVGVDGRVTGARIEHSSGFRDLDRAAVTALSLCTFKPAMQGDVAQAGWALIAYEWKLD
ncbi:MAG: energy transducer TonB [Pseudomonadota bacterium]|nr:energy transducer TonB [Pseudomonadota bacterium]